MAWKGQPPFLFRRVEVGAGVAASLNPAASLLTEEFKHFVADERFRFLALALR
jgi:hypothetical protein